MAASRTSAASAARSASLRTRSPTMSARTRWTRCRRAASTTSADTGRSSPRRIAHSVSSAAGSVSSSRADSTSGSDRRSRRMRCDVPPERVDRYSQQYNANPDRGPAWLRGDRVGDERERRDNERARCPRIARDLERSWHGRLATTKHEDADGAEGVEDPPHEYDVREQLLEGAGGGQHHRPRAAGHHSERRRSESRMDLGEPPEEQIVLRHRVVDAWRGDGDAVDGGEDRHEDGRGDELRGASTHDHLHGFGSHAIRRGDAARSQRREVADVGEYINADQRRGACDDGARKGALRVDRLARRERDVLPALVRPQHTDHA